MSGCVRLPGPAYGQLSQLCGQISGQEQLQDSQPGETRVSLMQIRIRMFILIPIRIRTGIKTMPIRMQILSLSLQMLEEKGGGDFTLIHIYASLQRFSFLIKGTANASCFFCILGKFSRKNKKIHVLTIDTDPDRHPAK